MRPFLAALRRSGATVFDYSSAMSCYSLTIWHYRTAMRTNHAALHFFSRVLWNYQVSTCDNRSSIRDYLLPIRKDHPSLCDY